MAASRCSRLLVAGAIGIGLALAYCGGTVETDETLGTNESQSIAATDAGKPLNPVLHAPVAAPETSFRARVPEVVAVPPAEPTPPPCPGCPPSPGTTPIAPSPIDTPQ